MTATFSYSLSFIPSGFLLPSLCLHVVSVTHTVCKEKLQSFHADVMDGVASLVEVIRNKFVSQVFNVRNVFFEAGVKGASSFPAVEFSAFGTVNDVYNAVRQAVELFRDVHPVILELVQMKGYVPHFAWLYRVVPAVIVVGWRSLVRTSMSRTLASRLYAISGG